MHRPSVVLGRTLRLEEKTIQQRLLVLGFLANLLDGNALAAEVTRIVISEARKSPLGYVLRQLTDVLPMEQQMTS